MSMRYWACIAVDKTTVGNPMYHAVGKWQGVSAVWTVRCFPAIFDMCLVKLICI